MIKNLNPGMIGIHGLGLAETIDLAMETGFGSIDFDIREVACLADDGGVDRVRALFQDAGVRPGQWGLPVAWNQDGRWEHDLEQLPGLAKLACDLGCTRTATWCPSGSDERRYDENFQWHVARFRPIAEVLAQIGPMNMLATDLDDPRDIRAEFGFAFRVE